MKSGLKAGILLMTLAIPVFIWLFLKNFGSNQYEVPVFYQNGIDSLEQCKSGDETYQVRLPEMRLVKTGELKPPNMQGLTVTYLLPDDCGQHCELVLEEMARLQDVFSDDEQFSMLTIGSSSTILADLSERYNRKEEKWRFFSVGAQELEELRQCGFVLQGKDQPFTKLVLTDQENRIRGYYDGNDPEEADRLILEIKILLYTLSSVP
jgi:protein SCO1/2